jgi:hypothetical protein
MGHGLTCAMGHHWSYDRKTGKPIFETENKTIGKIQLVKTKELLSGPDEKTAKLIIDFIQFAADFLKLTEAN